MDDAQALLSDDVQVANLADARVSPKENWLDHGRAGLSAADLAPRLVATKVD